MQLLIWYKKIESSIKIRNVYSANSLHEEKISKKLKQYKRETI